MALEIIIKGGYGAGKSTMAFMISQMITANKGHVILKDEALKPAFYLTVGKRFNKICSRSVIKIKTQQTRLKEGEIR
jgi:ABC-type antimicrobial peptide transport system ATPase subunit